MADNSSIARHIKVRPEWLALHREDIIDPGLPIVDAHHHILDRPGNRYLPDDLLQDLGTGHNIRATVYVQSSGMRYRQDGDPAFAPVGEVAFARDVAVASLARTGGVPHVCAAIVGFADLALGEGVRPVLEAMVDEGGGRFRGIRDSLTWDDLGQLNAPGSESRQGRMGNESVCSESYGWRAPHRSLRRAPRGDVRAMVCSHGTPRPMP
jgi:L-fuconolactonase